MSEKPDADNLKRCTICGFIVDTSYKAEKPTIDFSTAGRATKQKPPQEYVAMQAACEALERWIIWWTNSNRDIASGNFQVERTRATLAALDAARGKP